MTYKEAEELLIEKGYKHDIVACLWYKIGKVKDKKTGKWRKGRLGVLFQITDWQLYQRVNKANDKRLS